jgi:hypothetical protein
MDYTDVIAAVATNVKAKSEELETEIRSGARLCPAGTNRSTSPLTTI